MKFLLLVCFCCLIFSGCSDIFIFEQEQIPDVPTNPGEGSVIHLSMNNTINNSINNSVNMTLSSGIENYTTGMFNASFVFDGSTTIQSTNINITTWDGYSVCFWVNLSTTGATEQFVRFDHGGGQYNQFFWVGNDMYFRARDQNSQCTRSKFYTTTTGYRQVCGVINGTHQELYFDSNLESSGSCDYTFDDSTPNPLEIGVNVYSDIDEVWLFNRSLSKTEIDSLEANNNIGYVDPTYCLKATNNTNIYWDSC